MRSATTSDMKWGEVYGVKEIEEQSTEQLGAPTADLACEKSFS